MSFVNKPALFFMIVATLLSLHPDAACGAENKGETEGANSGAASVDQKEAVIAWFKKYDQIRREAELSLTEKFQTMSFLDKNIDDKTALRKRDQELVARMNAKYAKADEEMKNLQPVAATKELQDGYANYFSQVHKIFTRYIKDAGAADPNCSRSTVREQRTALEELDKANKKIDAQLRTKYGIAKHKHS